MAFNNNSIASILERKYVRDLVQVMFSHLYNCDSGAASAAIVAGDPLVEAGSSVAGALNLEPYTGANGTIVGIALEAAAIGDTVSYLSVGPAVVNVANVNLYGTASAASVTAGLASLAIKVTNEPSTDKYLADFTG